VNKKSTKRAGVVAIVALLCAAATAYAAGGTFVEQDVRVLHQFNGTGSASFGWAVSPVGDPRRKRLNNVLVSEAFNGPSFSRGSAYLYSSRTGRLLRQWDGQDGDWFSFAVADAGDTNRDGANEILLGAPGPTAAGGPGYLDLVSGKTGELLHRFVGERSGDAFGWAASSAGDVDRDRHADILVGAPAFHDQATAGRAYIYSGRTYELIRSFDGRVLGEEFGSGVGWTEDVDRDGVPDQIIGARDAPAHDGQPRGQAYVYSGKTGSRLYTIPASPFGGQFGSFFVAGVGDVNRDRTPDVYVGDYADGTNGPGAGRAAVFSGKDGRELRAWEGAAGEGAGPGRGAGDVDDDGRVDVIVGFFTAGPTMAGKVEIFSGRDGSLLRSFTSTTAGENLGFDAVGMGDVNGDDVPDALLAAATGDHVYLVAGRADEDDDN
jgi:hypothetical protein